MIEVRDYIEKFMEHISIDKELKEFETHLANNDRVVFSAKFGDGKTYFLNRYMESHQIWKDYTPKEERVGSSEDSYFVVLHPVNYVVAPNEDIFEYIKRDILTQLYGEGRIDGIDYKSLLSAIGETAKENILPALSGLVKHLPYGEVLNAAIEIGKTVYDNYQGDNHQIPAYLKGFDELKGGLYEHDAYTEVIEKTLEYIKKPADGEKARTVLIIEDLDRLDPGHLFRILNVLGAHVDVENGKNKFGFSNIVLVMDYDVTKSIFHHFYGDKANYEGYMSKYMSCYPYDYSITRIAKDNVIDYLSEECGLGDNLQLLLYDYEDVKDRENSFLMTHIDRLSVRDIIQLMDGIEKQYRDEMVSLNGYQFRSVVPVVKLLAVLVRLHIPFDYAFLAKQLSNDKGRVVVVGAFVAADSYFETLRFKLEGQIYSFQMCGGPDIIIKEVRFINPRDAFDQFGGGRKEANLQEVIQKALLKAKDYVWDAPQWQYEK